MDAVSIRVPYRNLKQEVELVGVDESQQHRSSQIHATAPPRRLSDGGDSPSDSGQNEPPKHCSMLTLILSCTIAAGVQFGWALQLSLLTPYIQTLGIGHEFSSFIWLCGPITGLVVQPCVGIWSDKCSSKYGRRRPFILVGSLMISVAVVIIGFSADIGYILGDTKEHCSTFKGTRTRAAIVFVIGFWMLDLANNTVQGPARALLADLSGPDQRNSANAVFCCWMAVGNILGFSSGASGNWHRWFPFLTSRACCEPCGNLKAAFLVAVVFLAFCTLVTLYFAKEVPLMTEQHHRLSDSAPLLDDPQLNGSDLPKSKMDAEFHHYASEMKSERHYATDTRIEEQKTHENESDSFNDSPGAVLVNLLTSLRHLPPAMHSVLVVMALTWLSWFPFFLFDTDWMGREVFHGDPKGDAAEIQAYNQGVREGAFGLLLNSVVLGISSFFIEPMCQWMGGKKIKIKRVKMGLKLKNVLPVFVFLLLASTAKAQTVFDVTSAKYGGKPNSDITQALSKAWTDACASTSPSKLVVPKGTFKFLGTTFKGPCKAPIAFQLQGILQAPADGNQLPKKDTWISFDHIDRLTISGGGTFDGQGAIAWKQNDCHKNKNCKSIAINLRFNFITNSRIEYITTKDSKNFHVNVLGCTNVAFHHFTVSAPKESINTDGIHIGRSTGISIIDSTIKTGDDCISIGDGTKNLNVTNVTCGPGHGISIGSLGRYQNEEPVSGITIKNCTLTDTQNGVRIKTWPASPSAGTASDIHFEDIIMVNVGNPILIDQEYCPWNQCTLKVPSKVKISNVSFKNIKGTSTTPLAVKLVCSKGLPCEKVELSDIDLKYTGNQGPLTSKCTNVKPTITRVTKPLACATSA